MLSFPFGSCGGISTGKGNIRDSHHNTQNSQPASSNSVGMIRIDSSPSSTVDPQNNNKKDVVSIHPKVLEDCYLLEHESYPPDEAASPENLVMRASSKAGDYFAVMFSGEEEKDQQILGMINATRTHQPCLTSETMSRHDPLGERLCIHSVVVKPAHRRKGHAKRMLCEYIKYIKDRAERDGITEILLITKSETMSLYFQCGFALHGISETSHGKDKWFQMGLKFNTPLYCIDAFTSTKGGGNPAAVCIVAKGMLDSNEDESFFLDVPTMQRIAREMNLAETAFVTYDATASCSALFGGDVDSGMLLCERIMRSAHTKLCSFDYQSSVAQARKLLVLNEPNNDDDLYVLALSYFLGLVTNRKNKPNFILFGEDRMRSLQTNDGEEARILLARLAKIKITYGDPMLFAVTALFTKPDEVDLPRCAVSVVCNSMQLKQEIPLNIGESFLVEPGSEDRVMLAFGNLFRFPESALIRFWSSSPNAHNSRALEMFKSYGWSGVSANVGSIYLSVGPSILADYARCLLISGKPPLLEFSTILLSINTHSILQEPPNGFGVGPVWNAPGTNLGSFRVLSFARAMGLGKTPTLRLWAEHYQDVLKHPDETNHGNIRSFIRGGWACVQLPNSDYFGLVSPNQIPHSRWHAPTAYYAGSGGKDDAENITPDLRNTPIFGIRWFTPSGFEIDLCGHATLASAYALTNIYKDHPMYQMLPNELVFRTQTRGNVSVICHHDGTFELNFPMDPPSVREDISKAAILEGLRLQDASLISYIGHAMNYLLVEIRDESGTVLKNLTPNIQEIAKLPTKGVIVTCSSSSPIDFRSRFFAPNMGIDEDPVTGSSHTVLAVYWGNKLKKHEMKAEQVSKRFGELHITLKEDQGRVLIRGRAVMFWKGYLN